VHVGQPDAQADVTGQVEPRRHVRVVVEPGDDDLVPGAQLPAEGAGHRVVQRGHVRPEDDLVGAAAEEARRGCPGIVDDLLDPPAGGVGRAGVAAGFEVDPGNGFSDLVGRLSAAGRVEIDEIVVQRAEPGADAGQARRRRQQAGAGNFADAVARHDAAPGLVSGGMAHCQQIRTKPTAGQRRPLVAPAREALTTWITQHPGSAQP